MELSEDQRRERFAALEAQLADLRGSLRSGAATLEQAQAELEADPRLGELETARRHKASLSARFVEVDEEVDTAKAAVAESEASIQPTTPIVPSEAQLRQAYASDADLAQAVEQRDAKARAFHRRLMQAMSESQTPLTAMLTTLEAFASGVQERLASQADDDIRRELERIASALSAFQEAGERFSQGWDGLTPKLSAWTSGGRPEALLEYQQKAEALVRELHKRSDETLSAANRGADAMGRGGSEMTQRRVIQSALLKLAHACDDARKGWVMAAAQVVPANNLQLKALRNAIRDLTPRIEQRRAQHRQNLIEHLEKVRLDEWDARRRIARADLADATRRHQELTNQYLAVDATLSKTDEQLRTELHRRREDIQRSKDAMSQLERDEAVLSSQVEHLQSGRTVSLAGAVRFEALAPRLPAQFDLTKRNGALGFGGLVAAAFVFGVWILTRPRRSQRGASP
jgi:hypothetical protein